MADKKTKLHRDCDTDGYKEPDLLQKHDETSFVFSFIMESKHPHV